MSDTVTSSASSPDRPQAPKVAVLLATFNGARFLQEQIESLARQAITNLDVYVSDDGSSDDTLVLLEKWRNSWVKGSFTLYEGPSIGFSGNFRSLLTRVNSDADYVAFSDQDDIWFPNKLGDAISELATVRPQRAALYCGRTRLIDEQGNNVGMSPLFSRPPNFRNALLQNIGGGNTMVMNRLAFSIVAETARRTEFVSHDWWTYIVISGVGGVVIYDPQPHISYRQHRLNLVGGNDSWPARFKRLTLALAGAAAEWNSSNVAALERCIDLLDPDALAALDDFKRLRAQSGLPAVRQLWVSKLHRQTLFGNLGVMLASAGGRM
jgi:glycosyltransferase involved in cell wall biosynthesis